MGSRRFDDLSLRYLLSVPAGMADDRPAPLILMLHGRGADMHDLADLAPLLDPPRSCRFVFANAPKPFEAYPGSAFGWTWFDGWPPIRQSLVESRQILLRFIDEIAARYPIIDGRFVVSGFSQGALMALDVGLRTDEPVAGIMSLSGGLYESDPPDLSGRRDVPVLIAHGEYDDVVPVHYARRARLLLEEAGLDVEYHEYPMAHQIVMEEIAVVKEFVTRVTR